MISYYSWDHFDEKTYWKNIGISLISLTNFFNGDLTEAHGLVILDIIFDAGKWLGSLGQPTPKLGVVVLMNQSPSESEGIRRLVSWLSSPSRWDGWYHVIPQICTVKKLILSWDELGYPFFQPVGTLFFFTPLWDFHMRPGRACSSNRRHPQVIPPNGSVKIIGICKYLSNLNDSPCNVCKLSII